jgi:hypothetical protein
MNWLRTIVAWVVVALSSGWFAVNALDWPTKLAMVRHGRETVATVVRRDCPNHASVVYAFSYDARNYVGRLSVEDCPNFKVGSRLPVWFLPDNPGINKGVFPPHELASFTTPVLITVLVFPTLVTWRMRRFLRPA